MRLKTCVLIFPLWLAFVIPSAPKDELLVAEGAVVAILGSKDSLNQVEPYSVGDAVEIYIMRVDRWSRPQKEKYIIVEYSYFPKSQDDVINDDLHDKTFWRFEVRRTTPEQRANCQGWISGIRSFYPTAFGARVKLPNPKKLECFLMKKRPSAVRETTPGSTTAKPQRSAHP